MENRLLLRVHLCMLYSQIYFHSLLFYYDVPLRSMCSESPLEAAWNRGYEGTIISASMIDIIKEIL